MVYVSKFEDQGRKTNKHPWLYIVTPIISWWILEGESVSACRWGRIPKSMLELLSLASVRTCIPSSFALSWGDVFCCFSQNTDTHHVLWETKKTRMSKKSEIFVVQWLKTSTSKQKQSRQSILANLGLWLASVYLSTTTPWCFSWSSQPLDLELKQKTRKNMMRGSVHWKYWMDVFFVLVQAHGRYRHTLKFCWFVSIEIKLYELIYGHTSLCQMARHG